MKKYNQLSIKSVKTIYLISLILLTSCSEVEVINLDEEKAKESNSYPITLLDAYSKLNKATSWYRTNISFKDLYNVHGSKYWGFESINGDLIPFLQGTWSPVKEYYWNDLGGYLFTDLNGDGKRDLWAYYWKNPWPTNANGLHLFVDDYTSDNYDLQKGLTQVRKQVLSDFNNDSMQEVMLFSSGYDAPPFPGDSLAYFDVKSKSYHYLTADIGYFHGGATGDVDLDGNEDIVAYSGGSAVIPTHPVFYQNKGAGRFLLSNGIYKNFNSSDNYYTVELFDIDNDGRLDLFLGGKGVLLVIKNEGGIFDRNLGINLQTDISLEVMDIDFFDFNKDGENEILVMNNKNGYNGYSLKLYKFNFKNHEEITSAYFEGTEDFGWIKWIHIFDFNKDGYLDIVADGLFGKLEGSRGNQIYWKNIGNKFVRTYINR
jgi:hypothetical protein